MPRKNIRITKCLTRMLIGLREPRARRNPEYFHPPDEEINNRSNHNCHRDATDYVYGMMNAGMDARHTYQYCKQPEKKAQVLVGWENDRCYRSAPDNVI